MRIPEPDAPGAIPDSFYGIRFRRSDATESNTSDFKGKTVLIVNTACQDDSVSQLAGLETLYRRFKDRNFLVVAVPSDSFGNEPWDNAEIGEFLASKYGVTFPVLSKVPVKGGRKHPLFAWLTDRTVNPDFGGKVSWDYNKFLVSGAGEVIARFGSRDEPDDEAVLEAVEAALDDRPG